MNPKDCASKNGSLRQIFEQLEGISYALERGLSMLIVLEEASFHDADSQDIHNTLTILYEHLHTPAGDLKALTSEGLQLVS